MEKKEKYWMLHGDPGNEHQEIGENRKWRVSGHYNLMTDNRRTRKTAREIPVVLPVKVLSLIPG